VGINHNGHVELAKKMIGRCALARVDAVKFQMFDKGDYADRPEIEKCFLSREHLKELKKFADEVGIEWFCTPEKIEHIEFLKNLGVKRLKVNHLMCDNGEFLCAIRDADLPVYISVPPEKSDKATEMIMSIFHENPLSPLAKILYCPPKYPSEPEDMKLKQDYGCKISGFSCHNSNPLIPILFMAAGYEIIEVHVKLDNWHVCPDANVSVDMIGLRKIVEAKKMLEEML
jgi:sialic acid synthase SpsE